MRWLHRGTFTDEMRFWKRWDFGHVAIAFGDMAECPLNHLLSLGEQFSKKCRKQWRLLFPGRGVSALTSPLTRCLFCPL